MAIDPKVESVIGLHRFGLGPKRDSLARVGSDVRGALLADLDRRDGARLSKDDLPSSGEAMRDAADFRRKRRMNRRAEAEANRQKNDADRGAGGMQPSQQGGSVQQQADDKPKPRPGPGVPQQIFLDEAAARFDGALIQDIGFTERLVWFWSNHFCVSADKGLVRSIAGAFEREAIRPHVLGRFADMLLAVESHPAMLYYLDNARSIGPDSMAGMRRHKGLNENLARETMELHTLGVRTGYTQADVTNFAKVITGWTVVPTRFEKGGEFVFNPRMHEPGAQTVIGKAYGAAGVAQGRAVLADLARNPATAKHIATKLARHFVADEPPQALVDRLAKTFIDTDGDLKRVSRALIEAPESWDVTRAKLKKPSEWIVAALRATDAEPRNTRPLIFAQASLGEPLWRPPAPKGFEDDNAAWFDGLPQRLDISNLMARRMMGDADPMDTLEAALGPLASADTRQAVRRAESKPQALALLVMAPEFQRR
jgi:uncharacterized protein (DUF1800 family)